MRNLRLNLIYLSFFVQYISLFMSALSISYALSNPSVLRFCYFEYALPGVNGCLSYDCVISLPFSFSLPSQSSIMTRIIIQCGIIFKLL